MMQLKSYESKREDKDVSLIQFEDDGPGIPQEYISRVTDPFFTTNFQGRGLGMAAVYGIIKNHDGWIFIDSESEKFVL